MEKEIRDPQPSGGEASGAAPLVSRELLPAEIERFKKMLSILKRRPSTKSLEKLRCAIYARKSQRDEKDVALDAQINYCLELIGRSELLQLAHIFQEDDRSGMSTEKRTEFLKMFELVGRHEVDVIVVYKWDRFARNRTDVGTWTAFAAEKGCYVLAGDQNVVVQDAASKLTQDILWDFNEYYARDSAEKTKNALVNEAKKGEWMGGRAPFGYTNSPRSLEINPEEAALVSDAFDMALNGHSTAMIAESLNKTGQRTHREFRFTKQSVAYMLRNPVYTGRLVYNRTDGKKKAVRVAIKEFPEIRVEGAFERIIDDDTFERVQAILEGKKAASFVEREHIYLLSGLLRCKSCGRLMVGSSHRGGRSGQKRYAYQCQNHRGSAGCGTKPINADYIEAAAIEAALPMIQHCLDNADLQVVVSGQLAVATSNIVRTEKSIKYTERSIEQAFKQLSSANPHVAAAAEKMVERESAALQQLQEQLKSYKQKKLQLQQTAASPVTVTAEMLLSDRSAARTLLQLLFSSIEVDGDDITFVTK